MSARVLYTCYQPYLLDVAVKMHELHQWEPIYWFTLDATFPEVGAEIRKRFPQIITHDYNDAIRGKAPEQGKDMPVIPVDEDILISMSEHETIALCMMDRNDLLGNFTYQARLINYQYQVKYWNSVLESLKPDVVFFEALPHEASDFILYQLARKKNIRTIMFNFTAIFFDKVSTMETYEKGPDMVIRAYEKMLQEWKGEDVKISSRSEEYINKVSGKYEDNMPWYLKERIALIKHRDKPLTKIITLIQRATNVFKTEKWKRRLKHWETLDHPSVHAYHKLKGVPFKNSLITNRQFFRHTEEAFSRKKKLLQYYNSLANKNPDLEAPFIYCPFHYQPEATTSPLGGYFVNQQLMVEMLARSIPAGWKVYVKEHFSQFHFNLWGEPSRDREYYDRLKEIPNVELITLDLDSYTLIEKSKAISTISGSVSLEATIKGKAVLAFGHSPVYYPCEGVFYTPTNALLSEALQKIISGYKPVLNKIKMFIKATEENSFRGGIGTSFNYGDSNIYRQDNAAGHYQALIYHFENLKEAGNHL